MRVPPIAAQAVRPTGATLPSFEVASIKLSDLHRAGAIGIFTFPGGRVTAGLSTFKMLVTYAFDVQPFQVSAGPAWINDTKYDIIAIPPSSSPASKLNPPNPKLPPNEEQQQMLQSLLMDRFQLKFHRADRVSPVYLLERGRGQLKLEAPKDKDAYPWVGGIPGGAINGDGLRGENVSMQLLARRLGLYLGRPVIDRTGLKGFYDFKYQLSQDRGDYSEGEVLSCILTSIKALGLELKAGKGPVETIVIDHVEPPTPN
jgi:uncharacterized protein (TIGR03435 family)